MYIIICALILDVCNPIQTAKNIKIFEKLEKKNVHV